MNTAKQCIIVPQVIDIMSTPPNRSVYIYRHFKLSFIDVLKRVTSEETLCCSELHDAKKDMVVGDVTISTTFLHAFSP